MESDDQQEAEKIRISLVLAKGCTDASLKVPSDPIAIPATTRKKGLSAIVNHLLDRKVTRDKHDGGDGNSEDDAADDSEEEEADDDKLPSIPFDFLLNNKLLRLSVEGAARREGLSLEKPIEICYFPARSAPQSDGESEQLPDWISALDYLNGIGGGGGGDNNGNYNMLYSGSCDGSIRLFHFMDAPNNNIHDEKSTISYALTQRDVIKAHSGQVKCLSSLGCANNHSAIVASGSIDQTLVTHIHEQGNDDGANNNKLCLHAVYTGGHSSSINSVRLASLNGKLTMASGDWDGRLCIWKVPQRNDLDDTDKEESGDTHKRKKHKGSVNNTSIDEIKEISPMSIFSAHKSNISGIVWGHDHFDNEHSTLFTSSWDHSIKAWDVESQNEILALNGSKVVTSLGRCYNSNVVATGHPDCCVRLWDMRTNKNGDGNVFDGSLRPSHKSWVSAVQWSPKDPFVLASSSHDGSVKVWDIRSSLPLHSVRAHAKGQKSYCLAFTNNTIFSGGSDCILKKFKC